MYMTQMQKHVKITEIFEEIELDMSYVGCSAIEDKLQDVIVYLIL